MGKKWTFWGKSAKKVFQNRGDLCNKNSCLLQKYSKTEDYSKIEYSKIEVLLYYFISTSEEEIPSPNNNKVDIGGSEIPNSSTSPSLAVSPRLMEKINASKDVGEHTVFGGSDVPPMGVTTEHQADLEKVIWYTINSQIQSVTLLRIQHFRRDSNRVRTLIEWGLYSNWL